MDKYELIDFYKDVVLDPVAMQSKVNELMEKNIDGDITIPDPNNPFMFLLENSILQTSSFTEELYRVIRKLYPYLAETKEDLYHHLADDTLMDVFATPSIAKFAIYLNKKDLINTFRDPNTGFIEFIIPKYSKIEVLNNSFSLLDDIRVRIINNRVYINYLGNRDKNVTFFDDTLEAKLIKDNNGIEWLFITIVLPQVEIVKLRDNLITTTLYKKDFKLNGKYMLLEAYGYDSRTGSRYKLPITYSNFVYDPEKTTLIVRPIGEVVNIEIPSFYIVDDKIPDNIEYFFYITNGKNSLQLRTLNIRSFTLSIPTDSNSRLLPNVNMYAMALTDTIGGRDEISLEDLRNKIINYAYGDNSIPITVEEIEEELNKIGFIYKGKADTILEREFLVSKNIDKLQHNVYSKLNIIQDTISLDLNSINSDFIDINRDKMYFIIDRGQIFKLENNKLLVVNRTEYENVIKNAISDFEKYNKNKYFFNQFKHILEYGDILSIRTYDQRYLTVNDNQIVYLSTKLKKQLTIDKRIFKFKHKKYNYLIYINKDSVGENINLEKLRAKLILKDIVDIKLAFNAEITVINNMIKLNFEIDTTGFITKQDEIEIFTQDDKNLIHYINKELTTELWFYSIDEALSEQINIENYKEIDKDMQTLFMLEKSNLVFLRRIKNLYTNYFVEYRGRKYEVYENDVYLRYDRDIYELDENGLPKTIEVDRDNDGIVDDIEFVILHHKGDIVKDSDGNPIIKHHKGDIKLDSNGKPILNFTKDVIHKVEFPLLEDIYLRVRDREYIKYFRNVEKYIRTNVDRTIDEFNKRLLENTKVKFTANRDLSPVILDINNRLLTFEPYIEPIVTLYINKDREFILTDEIKISIINVIEDTLNDNFSIKELEHKIENVLNDTVFSVSVKNITENEIQVIKYYEKSNKFMLNKHIVQKSDNLTIVEPKIYYDIVKV